MTRTSIRTLLAVIAGVALLAVVVGCGGDNAAPPPANTGTVRGQVVYFDYPNLPVTGVEVHVGNTVVYTEDGWFEAEVQPGTYQVVVIPPEGFTLPPGNPPTVTVLAGQTVTLPEPFVLLHESDQPPNPPPHL